MFNGLNNIFTPPLQSGPDAMPPSAYIKTPRPHPDGGPVAMNSLRHEELVKLTAIQAPFFCSCIPGEVYFLTRLESPFSPLLFKKK